jgi:hypothetical protein
MSAINPHVIEFMDYSTSEDEKADAEAPIFPGTKEKNHRDTETQRRQRQREGNGNGRQQS